MALLGIDIGGTSTKIALVSTAGDVLESVAVPTRGGPREFVASLANALAHVGPVDAIGVAVAGLIDDARLVMKFNPNIDWLQGFPLRDALHDAFRRPVVLDNDSNAAAWGEYLCGGGQGARRLLCLTIGTGVGGAMVAGGAIYRLSHQGAGDMGHVLVMPDGPRCSAGCAGCAEALISAPAVEDRALAAFGHTMPVRDLLVAAQTGDPRARSVLAETGDYLGRAVASLSPIFYPDRVLIAGGLAEAGELLLGPAEESFRSRAGRFYQQNVELRRAALGWQAGVVGAALLART